MADDRKNNSNDYKSPLERYLEKQKADKAAAAAREAQPAGKKPGLFAKAEAQAQAFANSKLSQKAAGSNPSPAPAPVDPRAKPYSPGEKPSLSGIERPEPIQPPTLSRWEKVAESRLSESEQRAQEAGAPPAPPRAPTFEAEAALTPSPAPAQVHVDEWRPVTDSELQPDGIANADFGIRLIAAFIDGIIASVFVYVLNKVVPSYLSWATWLIVVFAYYGYFYSTKGATPGKLLLNLEVVSLDGKTYISPWKAFFREAIGKTISTIPFLMGYIIVLIRQDHRALHDLLFDTRVIRKRP